MLPILRWALLVLLVIWSFSTLHIFMGAYNVHNSRQSRHENQVLMHRSLPSAQELFMEKPLNSFQHLERITLPDSGGTLLWGQEHAPTIKGDHLLFPMRKILNTSTIALALNDKLIGREYERKRCAKYGFNLDENRTSRRRIFWGSTIADESLRVLQTVATEVYGIFDTVSFIESNRTYSLHSRDWRWEPGSDELEALRSMFGQNTRVTVDYYVRDGAGQNKFTGYDRENRQRHNILERWRRNGMRPDDIGILGDTDEMYHRDFLRALQICDVPEFRKGQDCKTPKIIGTTRIFESSPECIRKKDIWYHPDALVGECIEYIGDDKVHPPPRRLASSNHNCRIAGHGFDNGNYSEYFKENPRARNNNMYPLWNPADIRQAPGGRQLNGNKEYNAFHLHNNFLSSREVRNKYSRYSERVERYNKVPLMLVHEDVGLMVSCVHNRTSERLEKGLHVLQGSRPLLYHNDEFRRVRHQEVIDLVQQDERLYGTVLNASCRGADCDTCDGSTCQGYEHRNTRVFEILKSIDNTDDAVFLREYIEQLQSESVLTK